jgi:hypothetical protein
VVDVGINHLEQPFVYQLMQPAAVTEVNCVRDAKGLGFEINDAIAIVLAMVQAWVDQKRLKRDILRLFYDVR